MTGSALLGTTLVRAFVVALAVSQARETRFAASGTKCKAGFPQIAMTPESSTWRRIRIILMEQVFFAGAASRS